MTYIYTITEKLKYYPILSVIFWIIPTIHRVAEFCNWEPYPFSLISFLLYSSLGFFDSLVFYHSSNATIYWNQFFNDAYIVYCCCFHSTNKNFERGDGLSESNQTRPGSLLRDSSSTSRVVFQKRISPMKTQQSISKQEYTDLKQIMDETEIQEDETGNIGVEVEVEIEEEENRRSIKLENTFNESSKQKSKDMSISGKDRNISQNSLRNSYFENDDNFNYNYNYNYNDIENEGHSSDSDSSSDDDDDDAATGIIGENNDDDMSLNSVRSYLIQRKKKGSFLDLDFPMKLHKDET